LFLFFADQLTEFYSAFNALTYITTRGILSALTALVVSFIIGPKLIQKLSLNDIGESIRKNGPGTHSVKQGTPTMGGSHPLLNYDQHTHLGGSYEQVHCQCFVLNNRFWTHWVC
jgi:phospho-N-acetylmuramoyl-pentapeptide-transferase